MADKPRGRPPLDDDAESVPVCVRLPARQYDEMYTRSAREGVSIPELIRRKLNTDPDPRYQK